MLTTVSKLFDQLVERYRLVNLSDETARAFALVAHERESQNMKWGVQSMHAPMWLAVLTEEVGELAQAIVEKECGRYSGGLDQIKKELTQVAAVAVQWLEALEDGRA